jgi:hypothetical protein
MHKMGHPQSEPCILIPKGYISQPVNLDFEPNFSKKQHTSQTTSLNFIALDDISYEQIVAVPDQHAYTPASSKYPHAQASLEHFANPHPLQADASQNSASTYEL